MALALGKSPIKPARWTVNPRLTESPDLFKRSRYLWPFWDISTPHDIASGATTTIVSPDVQFTPTDRGRALNFPGTVNDYLDTDISSIDGSFTAFVFFKTTQSDNGWFLDNGDGTAGGFQLFIDASVIRYRIDDTGSNGNATSGSTTIDDGQWHTVILSVDKTSSAVLYVDGNQDASFDISGYGDISGTVNLLIGAQFDGAGPKNFFIGDLSICGILDGAISSSTVRRMHNDIFSIVRPGPQIIPLMFGDAATGPSTIEASTSFSFTSSQTASNNAVFEADTSFNSDIAQADTNTATFENLIDLSFVNSYTTSSDAVLNDTVSIQGSFGVSSVGGKLIEEAASFATSYVLTSSSEVTIEGIADFTVSNGLVAQTIAILEPLASFDIVNQAIAENIAVLEAQSQYTSNIDLTVTRTVNFEKSASLTLRTTITSTGSIATTANLEPADGRSFTVEVQGRSFKITSNSRKFDA